MKRYLVLFVLILTVNLSGIARAGVDSDFKERPAERFVVYTGDGHYKQAYHWSFNENGQGPAVTIFLNHGAGGEWYDEIDSEFGPCGPDYINDNGDFEDSNYQDMCIVDGQGDEVYLADFNTNHVPVGPELEDFMLRKIVGSTQFAAWYWQDAYAQFDSPVHIFMVGRYNVVTDPTHLDNALFWLNRTNEDSVSRDTLPPYNFDGYGLADIDGDFRPMHAAPDIAGFDNMFLYKAVREQYPNVSLDQVIVEGRSNGGSAMIALAADFHIWPQHVRDFWARNLPSEPVEEVEPEIVPALDLQSIMNNPAMADAFNEMLSTISEDDVMAVLDAGESLQLAVNGSVMVGTAGEQVVVNNNEQNDNGVFDTNTFAADLADYVHGDFYASVKLIHALYPGCRLDGFMEQDLDLAEDEVSADGDTLHGYKVAFPMMFSFGADDSLYTSNCDDRVTESASQTDVAGTLAVTTIADGTKAVIGEVFDPAQHGFDYKDVYKNLPEDSANDQAKASESRRAIERAVNQALAEMGLNGSYSLPYNLD